MKVRLNTIEKVKDFTSITSKYDNVTFDLSTGHYTVDGKSIMGIFSLDLTTDLNLKIMTEEKDSIDSILKQLTPYLI